MSSFYISQTPFPGLQLQLPAHQMGSCWLQAVAVSAVGLFWANTEIQKMYKYRNQKCSWVSERAGSVSPEVPLPMFPLRLPAPLRGQTLSQYEGNAEHAVVAMLFLPHCCFCKLSREVQSCSRSRGTKGRFSSLL